MWEIFCLLLYAYGHPYFCSDNYSIVLDGDEAVFFGDVKVQSVHLNCDELQGMYMYIALPCINVDGCGDGLGVHVGMTRCR